MTKKDFLNLKIGSSVIVPYCYDKRARRYIRFAHTEITDIDHIFGKITCVGFKKKSYKVLKVPSKNIEANVWMGMYPPIMYKNTL